MRVAITATSTDLPTGDIATILAGLVPGRRVLVEIAGMNDTWAVRDREHAPQPPGQRAISTALDGRGSSLPSGIVLAATVDLYTGVVLDSLDRWAERDVIPALLADPTANQYARTQVGTALAAMADWLASGDRHVHSVVDAGYLYDITSAAMKWLTSCEHTIVVTAATAPDLGRLSQIVREGLVPSGVILLSDRALGHVDAVRAALDITSIPVLATSPLSQPLTIPEVRALIGDRDRRRARRRTAAHVQMLVTAQTILSGLAMEVSQ